MSENYQPIPSSGPGVATSDSDSTLDTAKQEATELKDTAVEQAKDVAGTVKHEASAVLGEAKSQARDLFAQTQSEFKEQANTQQQRVAAGLHSVSSELDSMAANSGTSGVATELVRQISGRASRAANWLGDRDPSAVLSEVKRYARRKPGTFILAAAITGVVVGRLTRALAANASDKHADAQSGVGEVRSPTVPAARPTALVGGTAAEDTPVYAQSATALGGEYSEGDRDVRSDTL